MTKYLISFPSAAMEFPSEDLPAVAEAAHAVLREAKAAGVWVFGGGINEDVDPVRVAADGSITPGPYPQFAQAEGGYAVFELPSRDQAVMWAARFAEACRCDQELREFQYDPES